MVKTSVGKQKPAENTLASEALAMFTQLQHEQLVQLEKDFGEADAEKSSQTLPPIPPHAG
jgi:hypothetical protein